MLTSSSLHESRIEDHSSDGARLDIGDIHQRLVGIATRILRNRDEAEDVAQDAWVRWQNCDRSEVRDPTGFLITMTARLAINATKSARARRESSVSEWHPEPVDKHGEPSLGPERREQLEAGLRIVVDRLSTSEGAAFVLREGFDYTYLQIAELLHITIPNARQLVSRARKHITEVGTRRADYDPDQLVRVVSAAAGNGMMRPLEHVLAVSAA